MIFQLIYRSTAARPFYPGDLLALLEQSRRNNERLEITGMLLFRDGQFMQLLEGDEEVVRARFEIIAHDPRHKWVHLVMSGPSGRREFTGWSMGFDEAERSSYPAIWQEQLPGAQPFPEQESVARTLLLSFRPESAAA